MDIRADDDLIEVAIRYKTVEEAPPHVKQWMADCVVAFSHSLLCALTFSNSLLDPFCRGYEKFMKEFHERMHAVLDDEIKKSKENL